MYILTLAGGGPSNGSELNRGVLGMLRNIMNCGTFGFDWSSGVRGQGVHFSVLPQAFGLVLTSYNCVDTTMLHVTCVEITSHFKRGRMTDGC